MNVPSSIFRCSDTQVVPKKKDGNQCWSYSFVNTLFTHFVDLFDVVGMRMQARCRQLLLQGFNLSVLAPLHPTQSPHLYAAVGELLLRIWKLPLLSLDLSALVALSNAQFPDLYYLGVMLLLETGELLRRGSSEPI